MPVNRWGVEVKKGHFVQATGTRGGVIEGRVETIDNRSAYAKAYGPTVTLETGQTCALDDVSYALGPMKIGPGGVVGQNPLTRIKRSEIKTKRSQASGHPAPSERLKKRRAKTAAMVVPGVFSNPLTRVRVTDDSQRPHLGPRGGKTKKPTARLTARREYTDVVPAGFYANPAKAQRYQSVYVDGSESRSGFEFGMDEVTPVTFKFTPAATAAKKYAYAWSIPPAVIKSPDFQAWARGAGGGVVCSLRQLRARLKAFAGLQ